MGYFVALACGLSPWPFSLHRAPSLPYVGRFHGAALASGGMEMFTWGSSRRQPGDMSLRSSPASSPAWRPSNAELVMRTPIREVEVLPKRPSIARLLEKLPPALRQVSIMLHAYGTACLGSLPLS